MSISNLLTAGLLSVAAATLTSELPVAVLPFWGLNTIWLLHVCAHAGAVTSASPTMTTAKTQCFFCIPFVLPGLNVELHNRPTQSLVRCVASGVRSEEHTSELQSRLHLVCRLLLEKKNKKD